MMLSSAILALTLLTNAVDTARQVAVGMPAMGVPFDITGTVVSVRTTKEAPFIVADASGSLQIERENAPLTRLQVAPGDRVRIWGTISTNGIARIGAMGTDGRILAHGVPPPERTDATAAQVLDHRVDFRLVRLRGIVQDARIDETDDKYAFLMIQNGGDTVFCVFAAGHPAQKEHLLFSVRDDGLGFDPDRVPGVAQGHFGLDGVRKRLRRLGGTLALTSRPGRGTIARATIRPPQVLSKAVSA